MARVAPVQTGILLVLSACFIKPDPPGGSARDGGSDGQADSAVDAFVLPTCDSVFSDTFDTATGSACAPWGGVVGTGSGSAVRTGTMLSFLPAPSPGGGYIYCQSAAFDLTNGTSIELVRPVSASVVEQTYFRLASGTGFVITTSVTRKLAFECGGAMTQNAPPYDPVAHRWLKLAVVDTGTAIQGQVSADGGTWTDYGARCPVFTTTVPPTGAVQIGGGGSNGLTAGLFDNFNVVTCPP